MIHRNVTVIKYNHVVIGVPRLARCVCRHAYVTRHEVPAGLQETRPASIPTGVKPKQYKRTFTSSLHFYGLNATAAPHYGHQRNVVNHRLTLLPPFTPFLPLLPPLPSNSPSPRPQWSTWHLRETSGL